MDHGHFSSYSHVPGLDHTYVRSILVDSRGHVWVGTENGLYLIDPEKVLRFDSRDGLVITLIGPCRRTAMGRHGLHHHRWTALLPERALRVGTVEWRGRRRHSHRHVPGPRWSVVVGYHQGRLVPAQLGSLAEHGAHGRLGSAIRVLASDHDGNLWVGTRGGGLARWRDGTITIFNNGLFAGNDVRALVEDTEGSLWIGSPGIGLLRLRDPKFSQFGEPEGPSGSPPGASPRVAAAGCGWARMPV